MQDIYLDIREGRDLNLQWIIETNLRVLRDYWKFDKFLQKLAKAKASRASVKRGSLHCNGSATIESTRA